MAELSLVSVVLFIASGGLVFILLFLFAKRQIVRFTLKSARRPHVSIGSDAPKTLRQEIQRRLDRVEYIKYEPVLLTEQVQKVAVSVPNHYHYRMKALDAYTNAIECLKAADPKMETRYPNQTIRQYLFSLCPSAVTGPSANIVHQFSDSYEHARHNAAVFGGDQFITYMELLDKLIRMIKMDARSRNENAEWKKKTGSKVTDTEVVFQPGRKGFEDASVRVQQSKQKPTSLPQLPDISSKFKIRQRTRTEQREQIQLVDSGKSSGYSSTDRSSSSRGSAEKLIPVAEIVHKEDSV